MPRKRRPRRPRPKVNNPNVMGLHAEVVEQPITDTLELNYMPYAMSVIVSRAIPEIDGFKPSHRKLLYTMYKMGLLTGARTKCANIVGQTMRLNPHGDAAIYDTMVRLARGYGPCCTPSWTPRATSARSTPGIWPAPPAGTPRRSSRHLRRAVPRHRQRHRGLCGQLRQHHERAGAAADHLPEYPGVGQQGIAVGMASQFCGFNLGEVCDTTIAYLKNPTATSSPRCSRRTSHRRRADLRPAAIEEIYHTGRGSSKGARQVALRQRGKSHRDLRDPLHHHRRGHHGQGRRADQGGQGQGDRRHARRDRPLRPEAGHRPQARRRPRQADAEALQATPLQDTFACNFNVLIAGMPRVMGVREILEEWTPGAPSACAPGVLRAEKEAGQAAPAARASSGSCSTSTRPSTSSGRRRRRPRSSRT